MDATTTVEPKTSPDLPISPDSAGSNEVTPGSVDQPLKLNQSEATVNLGNNNGAGVLDARKPVNGPPTKKGIEFPPFSAPKTPLFPATPKTSKAGVTDSMDTETAESVPLEPVQDEVAAGEQGLPMVHKIHPAAELFPMLNSEDLLALAEDIAAHGLLQPIVRYQGQILDGRNRLQACELAGVTPEFKEYDGDAPVSYVVSANLKRRHLEKSQLAAMALEIAPMFKDEAAKRQQAGVSVKKGEGGKTLEKAAKEFGVSTSLVEKAKKIKTLSPKDFELIHKGKKRISQVEHELKAKTSTNPTGPDVKPKGHQMESSADHTTCQQEQNELTKSFDSEVASPVSEETKDTVFEPTPEELPRLLEFIHGMSVTPATYDLLRTKGGFIRISPGSEEIFSSIEGVADQATAVEGHE